MKKFHLEIDIIENYCDNCNYRDENTCAHPDAKEGNRIENGFDVMIEIPDWCPLPDYNEQVQHFMNVAISFGRK